MDQVLTLIAPRGALAATAPRAARDALVALGATTGAPDWLAPAEAVDLPFAGIAPEQADAAARVALSGTAVDVIAQAAGGRRKRLLIADMDSTIVTTETLDELAGQAGIKDRIAAITKRAMNGELDFEGALRERVGMLKGLGTAALQRTWEETELMPGARELVATMRANGARCALVSGGFTFFTGRVAALVGFHEHHSNTLLETDGRLTGRVADPILGRNAKLATLKRLAAALGIGLDATLAVGDGANDLDMIQAAGLGVAFRAKPVVAAAARVRVDHGDLRALLFAQGYRAGEFAGA
jgi:phosphoserine phosphatase